MDKKINYLESFISQDFDKDLSSLYYERLKLKSGIENLPSKNIYIRVLERLLNCFNIYDKFYLLNKKKIIHYVNELLENNTTDIVEKISRVNMLVLLRLGMYIDINNDKDIIEIFNNYNKEKEKLISKLKFLETHSGAKNLFSLPPTEIIEILNKNNEKNVTAPKKKQELKRHNEEENDEMEAITLGRKRGKSESDDDNDNNDDRDNIYRKEEEQELEQKTKRKNLREK